MIQSSQVNRYTNFINLLRLNFKLLTKSISFYVILAILFVGSILINFLIYRNGGSFRIALSTLTPEFLLSICLSITLFNLLSSQYRDIKTEFSEYLHDAYIRSEDRDIKESEGRGHVCLLRWYYRYGRDMGGSSGYGNQSGWAWDWFYSY